MIPLVAAAQLIVVLGDSLASGHGIGAAKSFPAVLQERAAEQGYPQRIVNAGVSGDTSAGGLRRLDSVLKGDVRVLVVALGANDGLRGVPVAQVKANLSRIVGQAQARGIRVLLCGMEALPTYGWQYSVAFHQMYFDLAKQFEVPLVPFMLIDVIGNPRLMQSDHVHPNAAGARVMADHVWPYLEKLLDSQTVPSI
ncbi:MAG TPA: arylesterase [Vicinamibacterales bacterium]